MAGKYYPATSEHGTKCTTEGGNIVLADATSEQEALHLGTADDILGACPAGRNLSPPIGVGTTPKAPMPDTPPNIHFNYRPSTQVIKAPLKSSRSNHPNGPNGLNNPKCINIILCTAVPSK